MSEAATSAPSTASSPRRGARWIACWRWRSAIASPRAVDDGSDGGRCVCWRKMQGEAQVYGRIHSVCMYIYIYRYRYMIHIYIYDIYIYIHYIYIYMYMVYIYIHVYFVYSIYIYTQLFIYNRIYKFSAPAVWWCWACFTRLLALTSLQMGLGTHQCVFFQRIFKTGSELCQV